jgi:hypothetical protein
MPKPKSASSYSLTPAAKSMLQRMAISLGIPQSNVLELAVRAYATKTLRHSDRNGEKEGNNA